MRILFLIARQFNQLLQVKDLMGKGMDKGTIASKLKMQPFVVGKTMRQAGSLVENRSFPMWSSAWRQRKR